MTVTVTPTVDLTSTPPSVSLAVVDSTGSTTSATIQRYVGGGTSGTVRTPDGNPTPMSATSAATIVDYEAPFGVPVSYGVNGGAATDPVTLDITRPWLVHPFTPVLSMQVTLRPGSLTAETRPVMQGVFQPLGRKNPVILTDGVRKGSQSQLVVLTQSTAEFAALKALLADTSPLLLNIPASLDWGFNTGYIAVGDHKPTRVVDKLIESWRDNVLAFYTVDAPVSGTASNTGGSTGPVTRTWADAGVESSTWAKSEALYSTWANAEAGVHG